jgi:hypothetical protein
MAEAQSPQHGHGSVDLPAVNIHIGAHAPKDISCLPEPLGKLRA